MYFLPVEAKLDVFKCLNFDQLISIQHVNRHFCALINEYEGELARKEFFSISFVDSNKYFNKQLKMVKTSVIEQFQLNDQLLEKWQSAIDEQIPLYLFKYQQTHPKKDFFIILEEDDCVTSFLRLWLPLFPKNIEEMKIIRYWLQRLFGCFYLNAEFRGVIFNPEMVKLLFNGHKTISIKFIVGRCSLSLWCFRPNKNNVLEFRKDHIIELFHD
ncbi:hypothetical protein ACQ4LE_008814 [Meloidogyne hapla]|uniref:F-box domain-containing protein n=1 Tax=Meloidogyne hapla TaxID=6305 RepID=A0A1I8BHS6_MELHA